MDEDKSQRTSFLFLQKHQVVIVLGLVQNVRRRRETSCRLDSCVGLLSDGVVVTYISGIVISSCQDQSEQNEQNEKKSWGYSDANGKDAQIA